MSSRTVGFVVSDFELVELELSVKKSMESSTSILRRDWEEVKRLDAADLEMSLEDETRMDLLDFSLPSPFLLPLPLPLLLLKLPFLLVRLLVEGEMIAAALSSSDESK